MKKLLVLIVLLFSLVGCNSTNSYEPNYDSYLIDGVSTERLIVYTVNYNLYVDDLSIALENIDNTNFDMWYDEKTESDTYAYLYLRVKTEELDSFIEATKSFGKIDNYNIKSTDITNSYYDLESSKLQLETEKNRLIELMSEASIEEIIIINTRITEIDKELTAINKDLQEFDTSLLYSYVNIRISQNSLEKSFGSMLGGAFTTGLYFVGNIFKYGLIAIVFLIPIGCVIALPTTIGVIIYKKKKNKKK